jgi:hypothetical protein
VGLVNSTQRGGAGRSPTERAVNGGGPPGIPQIRKTQYNVNFNSVQKPGQGVNNSPSYTSLGATAQQTSGFKFGNKRMSNGKGMHS